MKRGLVATLCFALLITSLWGQTAMASCERVLFYNAATGDCYIEEFCEPDTCYPDELPPEMPVCKKPKPKPYVDSDQCLAYGWCKLA